MERIRSLFARRRPQANFKGQAMDSSEMGAKQRSSAVTPSELRQSFPKGTNVQVVESVTRLQGQWCEYMATDKENKDQRHILEDIVMETNGLLRTYSPKEILRFAPLEDLSEALSSALARAIVVASSETADLETGAKFALNIFERKKLISSMDQGTIGLEPRSCRSFEYVILLLHMLKKLDSVQQTSVAKGIAAGRLPEQLTKVRLLFFFL